MSVSKVKLVISTEILLTSSKVFGD